jgi:hypothetical protein
MMFKRGRHMMGLQQGAWASSSMRPLTHCCIVIRENFTIPGALQNPRHQQSHGRMTGIAASSSASGSPATSDGIRFVYEHPSRALRFPWQSRRVGGTSPLPKPTDVQPEVDVMVEGHTGLDR